MITNTCNIEKEKAVRNDKLSPILKWAGGKEQELKHILPAMPVSFNRYFEPFVGGGAVYFSINADEIYINDKSHELISLYSLIANLDDDFFEMTDKIIYNWKLIQKVVANNKPEFIKIYTNFSNNRLSESVLKNWITSFILLHSKEFNGMFDYNFNINIENFIKEINKNLFNKILRMKKIEKQKGKLPDEDIANNIESALKSAFYVHFRHIYNNLDKYNVNKSFATAIFFFIRNFAYSGMFRYNSTGGFNVPYGGIGYNRKNLDKKIEYLKSPALNKHLSKTIIENLDFENFLIKHKPGRNDFIFLDPPYDSEFSTYAKNEFSRLDQERLANYLYKCKAMWMLVIKNTDFIYNLYNKAGINISSFNKLYLVSFQNRNDKRTEHLIIKNY